MTTAGIVSQWKPRDTLANRLRLLRAELGLSQREFGERCQIPAHQIQSIEDGKSPRSLDAKVKKIVMAFGVDRDWLMWGGELADPDGPGPDGEDMEPPRGIEPLTYSLRGNRNRAKHAPTHTDPVIPMRRAS